MVLKAKQLAKKLLNDKKGSEELLIKEAKGYKIYQPNNWDGAKSLNFIDLRTYIEPLNKKSQN